MKVTIHKKEASHAFELHEDEPVLLAGLRQGMGLEYECATGTCGTCRAKLVAGELDQGWPEAPGRSKIKTDRGEFLMCQAKALTDCDIRVPGKLDQTSNDAYTPAHGEGTLHNIRRLTQDVLQFDVTLPSTVTFQPGQFVIMKVPGIDGFRAYSMTNFDDETNVLAFVVKRLPGGRFSDWIFDQFSESSPVELFGPLGKAVFEPSAGKNIFCIAGGSGIAGMMSILTLGCRDGYFSEHKGQLFFGVRTFEDIFFLQELVAFARQYPDNLKIIIALSEKSSYSRPAELPDNVVLTDGFVHLAARDCDLDKNNTIAYIAGPPPMVDGALRDLVVQSGYSAEQIRYDKFG